VNTSLNDLKRLSERTGINELKRMIPTPLSTVGDPLAGTYKPLHRGRLHQWCAPLAGIAGVGLVANAVPSIRIACIVYALSLVGLMCTSALYNRTVATTAFRPWMRWLDHAMIYLLIAGSYTPVCLHVLPRSWGVPLITAIWVGALGGVGFKFSRWRVHRRIAGTLYVILAGAYVVAIPKLITGLKPVELALMMLGNAFYLIGAVGLWLRRPNPSKDFGYHEVWHVYVVLAAASHMAMTWLAVS
jgi:hemolysin III